MLRNIVCRGLEAGSGRRKRAEECQKFMARAALVPGGTRGISDAQFGVVPGIR
jgi:hypothetical protein